MRRHRPDAGPGEPLDASLRLRFGRHRYRTNDVDDHHHDHDGAEPDHADDHHTRHAGLALHDELVDTVRTHDDYDTIDVDDESVHDDDQLTITSPR
jgi:hypothetical protein